MEKSWMFLIPPPALKSEGKYCPDPPWLHFPPSLQLWSLMAIFTSLVKTHHFQTTAEEFPRGQGLAWGNFPSLLEEENPGHLEIQTNSLHLFFTLRQLGKPINA